MSQFDASDGRTGSDTHRPPISHQRGSQAACRADSGDTRRTLAAAVLAGEIPQDYFLRMLELLNELESKRQEQEAQRQSDRLVTMAYAFGHVDWQGLDPWDYYIAKRREIWGN